MPTHRSTAGESSPGTSMKNLLLACSTAVCVLLNQLQPTLAADRGFKVVSEQENSDKAYLYKGSYAFLLGNGRYTKGWEPLSGAVEDIEDVAVALKRHGFEVSKYENLTRPQFEKAFTQFVQTSGQDPDNRLLFYYAGHGHTEPMATGEELGYLVMVDAPLPDIDPVNFAIHSVDMQSLITQARLIRSKHVLFLFDSCFSGSILNTRALVRKPRALSKYASEPVRQFITAGRANEAVPDRSYFKIAFVNMLDGREEEPVKDGMLTGEELGWYLKNKVTMYNPSQHPQYGKIRDPQLDQGDFIFLLPENPVEVEIKIRPVQPAGGTRQDSAAAESFWDPAPPPPVKAPAPRVEEKKAAEKVAAVEPPKPKITAPAKKKSLEEPAVKSSISPELEQFLKMLRGSDSVDKRRAAKILYNEYPYDPALLAAVNDELLKGYNRDLGDKNHVDAMAWLCKILGRSRDNRYLATVQEVVERTDSRKIRRHAQKSITYFPGYEKKGGGEESSMYDRM